MPNTRFRRCAQLIERRFAAGVQDSSPAQISAGAASVIGALAAPRGRQLRAQVRVRGKDAVKPGAGRRDQRRQFGDEIHWIPFHMCGPVAPRPCGEIDSRFSLIAGRAM